MSEHWVSVLGFMGSCDQPAIAPGVLHVPTNSESARWTQKKWMPLEFKCTASPNYSLQFVERFADDSMINIDKLLRLKTSNCG